MKGIMDKVIYKYQLKVLGRNEVNMPKGAEILHMEIQGGVPCIWALVDLKEEQVSRSFDIYMTGQKIRDNPIKYIDTYIDTYMYKNLVCHVFEVE